MENTLQSLLSVLCCTVCKFKKKRISTMHCFQALIHGLNRHYYSISINYRKNELEQKMLLNLHKKSWMDGLMLADYSEHSKLNETTVRDMLDLARNYNKVTLRL